MSYIAHKDLVDGDKKEDEDAQYLMSNLIVFQPLINPTVQNKVIHWNNIFLVT